MTRFTQVPRAASVRRLGTQTDRLSWRKESLQGLAARHISLVLSE